VVSETSSEVTLGSAKVANEARLMALGHGEASLDFSNVSRSASHVASSMPTNSQALFLGLRRGRITGSGSFLMGLALHPHFEVVKRNPREKRRQSVARCSVILLQVVPWMLGVHLVPRRAPITLLLCLLQCVRHHFDCFLVKYLSPRSVVSF